MKLNNCWTMQSSAAALLAIAVLVGGLAADDHGRGHGKHRCFSTPEDPQMIGQGNWQELPVFTIGESLDGYTPPGILDGIGAFKWKSNTVRLLVNHELTSSAGYAYTLANGATLTGARVSYFDIDRHDFGVCDTGLAYHTMYNRAGDIVTGPADLDFGGLNRLCSSQGIAKGEYGFKDDLYLTGEETGGGTEWVLDVERGELWAAPALGRAAWENVTPLETGDKDTVALLIGDDRGGAPLTLYIGTKDAAKHARKGKGKKPKKSPGYDFLDRNGLAEGQLFVWVADDPGKDSPEDFNGTGACCTGRFVEIDYYRPDLAGNGDYDSLGYATQAKQDALANAVGAFAFSRPEDLATNPRDGTTAVMASTGLSGLFPSDSWGTIYLIDVEFSDLSAKICIAYDGDDSGGGVFPDPDYGIRSPDNVEWSEDGSIYINEDRSVGGFGLISDIEASMWKLDPMFPITEQIERIAVIDRGATLPGGQTDPVPADIGNWESSGVLDVSDLFHVKHGTLLIADVQAHSVRDGSVGGGSNLVEGGQLFFLFNPGR